MAFNKITKQDLYIFFKELSRLVNKNIPIDEGLRVISQSPGSPINAIAVQVENDIKRGMSLSNSLKNISAVNPYAIALIKSGEESGSLTIPLELIVKYYRRSIIIRKMIVQSLHYPFFILILFFAVIIIFATFTIPKFITIFSSLGAELPPLTAMMLKIFSFFSHNSILIFITGFIIAIAYTRFRKTLSGQIFESNLAISIPIVGQSVLYDSLSRFCGALGNLLNRNVSIDSALVLSSATVDNHVTKKILGDISSNIAQGKKLSDAMEQTSLFSPSFIWMLKRGEDAGEINDTLIEISSFYDDRFEEIKIKVGTVLEPILIIIIGLIVGFMVMAIGIPIFSIPKVLGLA